MEFCRKIDCPTCNKHISTTSSSCPYCGFCNKPFFTDLKKANEADDADVWFDFLKEYYGSLDHLHTYVR